MTQKFVVERPEENNALQYCRELEMGNILFFPNGFEALGKLLEPYSKGWQKGEGFLESKTLNIEASAKTPLHGNRILRIVRNIDPKETLKVVTSLSIDTLIKKYGESNVPFPSSVGYTLIDRIERKMKQKLVSNGIKIALRSPYDVFMFNLHRFLKKNADFQTTSPKDHWEFPPNSCFAFFADQVSHIVTGRFTAETLLVPMHLLLYPEKSPLHILQRLSGRNLVDLECL